MRRVLNLGHREVSDSSPCYVIAEIGHNHQGSLEKCKDLIQAAVEAGADAVKLQKRNNRNLFTREMYNSPYNSENAFGSTYGEHREFLEFSKLEYLELKTFCHNLRVDFFSTAFDFESADFLEELDIPYFKIASGDLRNLPLIEYVARFGKPIFISTGGADFEDVQRVYDRIMPINSNICIMQCTSGYPCEYNELNLRVIETYRKEFPDVVVGFSSHDSGIASPVAGYVLGARVIEKHFTLNRTWKGTDHAFSLGPQGFRKMVRDIRRVEQALGDGIKRCYQSEEKPHYKMAKKIVAGRNLPIGHIISFEDLKFKSPADGVPPYRVNEFLGKKTLVALNEDDSVNFDVVEI
ncbi:TPA: N-acetylneuraminate synthase family protein [Legionella pneumophila]|nr:N-acetylneuraminate synthase family protein [Legionella pneumophila]